MKYTYVALIILLSLLFVSCFEKDSSDSQQELIVPNEDTQEVSVQEEEYTEEESAPVELIQQENIQEFDESEQASVTEVSEEESEIVDQSEQAEIDKKQIIDDAAEDLEALFDNFE